MTRPGEFKHAIVVYFSDDGGTLTFSQKRSLAFAVGNPVVDKRFNQGIAERSKLRHIRIETVKDGELFERKIIISDNGNPLFTGSRNSINIDGTTWLVVGRKGEHTRGPFAN